MDTSHLNFDEKSNTFEERLFEKMFEIGFYGWFFTILLVGGVF